MAGKDSIFGSKAIDKMLTAAAKEALGYVYYKTKLERKQCKDGSWKVRIVVYEKYKRPSRRHAALLKKEGVEVKMNKPQ